MRLRTSNLTLAVLALLFATFSHALSLTGVVSRKSHGQPPVAFDLPVDVTKPIGGNVTFESRAIGTGHLVVFRFNELVASAGTLSVVDEASNPVSAPAPTISTIAGGSEVLVVIPTLADGKRITVTLANVNNAGLNATASLGFKLGDTNHTGTLTLTDINATKARAGQSVSSQNFIHDFNQTGLISAADIAGVKSRSGLPPPANLAPVVNAGTNQTLVLPATAALSGTASDDGQPAPANLALTWSRVSGPATVAFANANSAATTATFTLAGTYVLRLSAFDGQLTSTSDVTVKVKPVPGILFEKATPWTKDVSAFPIAARSASIISTLATTLGGWGNGNKLQTDFSIAVLEADNATPRRMLVPDVNEYCFTLGSPDCDPLGIQIPVPVGGNIEGATDYSCAGRGAEDCHLLVIERSEKKLYELYQAWGADSTQQIGATGAFVWDLTKQYTDVLRGDQCTSADAAGLPIAALTPTADEVASGQVNHALRFILPNSRMKRQVYVRPATHAGAPSSTLADAPPYGVRFRLKASFDETPYSAGAKVILQALKKHGMILSDGGNIALTFADDRLSTAKWSALGINSLTFNTIPVTQFDVVDLGPEIPLTYDCVRAP